MPMQAFAVYWLVNLGERQLEVYTEPTERGSEPTYRNQQLFGLTDQVPFVIEGTEIARLPLRDLLP